MNIDDRARRAADDLATKASQANRPPVPGPLHRRLRPLWAFAAGAAVVAALVLVPLVLLGGPRDGDESAVTTLPSAPTTVVAPTTAAEDPPPTTSIPPTTESSGSTASTVIIDELASRLPAAMTPDIVASFGWGSGVGDLGRTEKGVGPCCFDVTHDGTVVVLDSARQRLVATDPLVGPRTIAQWDAGDFVPDSMIIARAPRDDVIFVLGMTNRAGRPHDLISMRLDGSVIERVETIVKMNTEMVESAGSVWATEWRADGIGWIQLATDVGDIFELDDQLVANQLLLSDRSRLELAFRPQDTGIIITKTDPNGVATRYEIDLGGESWGHFAVPYGDGILVTASTTDIDLEGSIARVAALLDQDGTVVEGFTWLGSRWAEVGPFGLTRLGPDGAIYELSSTESGIAVRRFALSQAGAFDALVARAGFGRAMTLEDATLWIAGPYRFDSQREWGEILEVDLRTRELVGVHEVPVPMNALDVRGGTVWAARAGDGGLPQNVLARLDLRRGEVDLIDLGELSTNDLAATPDGVWILSWNGGTGQSADLAFVSATGSVVERVVAVPQGAEPLAMQLFDGVLWIASLDGRVLRYDLATEGFLDSFDVGIAAFDILVEDDLFESDLSVWVSGLDGELVKLRSDGSIVAEHDLDGRRAVLAGGGAQGTAWAATEDGRTFFVGEGSSLSLIEATGVTDVSALVFDGRLWVLGSTLEVVTFGQ